MAPNGLGVMLAFLRSETIWERESLRATGQGGVTDAVGQGAAGVAWAAGRQSGVSPPQ